MPKIPDDDDTVVERKSGIVTVDHSLFSDEDWDKPEKPNNGGYHETARPCRLKLNVTNKYNLSLVQVRMLVYLHDCHLRKRVPTIKRLKADIGLAPGSGTHNPALGGVAAGTRRGKVRKGLLSIGIFGSEGHGMVERFDLDIDGKSETTFVLTDFGMQVAEEIKREMEETGRKLPGLKKYVNVYKILGASKSDE